MTKPGVSIITPTGMRQESLNRCAFYISRFNDIFLKLPVQWIVVDDGPFPSHVYYPLQGYTYVRPDHVWSRGRNSLSLNILAAIPHVKYDFVVFIEDDDWYSPDYLCNQ